MMSHVLLVDHDPAALSVMGAALKEAGLNVISVEDPLVAWDELEKTGFDLIISDILMPGLNGMDLIDRAFALNPNVEVLAISGGDPNDDGEDLLDQALSFGAEAILEKPFTTEELVRTARALLR